ncbi:hypothetical protein D3C76_1834280 [compost metagenome]
MILQQLTKMKKPSVEPSNAVVYQEKKYLLLLNFGFRMPVMSVLRKHLPNRSIDYKWII